MINEQKLFRPDELKKHIWNGDYDEHKNIIFLHPYCEFCDRHFYNEEIFQIHCRENHWKCEFCTEAHNHRFYKAFENLQIHFSMSHYSCRDERCIAESYIVFKTREELLHHEVI